MKKFFLLLTLFISLVACQEEPIIETPEYDAESERIWKALDGSYTTTFYVLSTENIWYYETIVFRPAEIPYKKEGYDVFGTATITQNYPTGTVYTEDHYYSIGTRYSKRTITFLKIGNHGYIANWKECVVADVTQSSFRMWKYGLTEEYNTHTYSKN